MSRSWKRTLAGSVVALILVLIGLSYYLYKTYRFPSEDPAVLESFNSRIEGRTVEIANRPKKNYLELAMLMEDVKSAMGNKAGSFEKKLWDTNNCPALNKETMTRIEPEMQAILTLNERLNQILADGLVLQADYSIDSDLHNYVKLRPLIFSNVAQAASLADQNRSAEAADQILLLMPLIDGIINGPTVIDAAFGIAVSRIADSGAIMLAPKVSEMDLSRFREALVKRPDTIEAILRGLEFEIIRRSGHINELLNRVIKKSTEKISVKGFLMKSPGADYFFVRFYHRERLLFLSAANKQMTLFRTWQASGAVEKPPLSDKFRKDLNLSILARLSWNGKMEDKLMVEAWRANLQRKAVIEAIDLELAQRAAGTRARLELPYDDESRIVIDGAYGCIVKSDSGKSAPPSSL